MLNILKYAGIFSCIVLLLVFVVYSFLKVRRTLKYAYRINKFVLKSSEELPKSLGDELLETKNKLIKKLSKYFANSKYFKNKSKRYSKYQKRESSTYFIYEIMAHKVLIALLIFLIYSITTILNGNFNLLISIFFLILGYYITDIGLEILYKKRMKSIEDNLIKAVMIMNNAFKSGLNITKAIDVVIRDLKGNISEEFALIKHDLSYGIEIGEAFNRFYQRVGIQDAEYITSSLNILNITGGNITSIFENIEKSLTNKKRLRDELNALTGSSHLVYRILTIMPFVLIGLIMLLDSSYFKPLFTHPLGYIICIFTTLLYILYIFIIKKILKVNL